MKRNSILALILVAILTLQLVSCGSKTNGNFGVATDDYYYSDRAEAESDYVMNGMSGVPSEPTLENKVSESVNDLSNRKIIKTATINFQTKTYDEFLDSLSACISAHGGYIQTSESRGGGVYQTNYSRNAYITVRIPEANYNSFMYNIGNLGSVTYKSEDTKDVTISYVDTESRITALEAEYDALLAILEKATKLDDVIQLQSRISDVTYQLESYKSQLRKYDDLISYCTVTINITEVQKEVINEERMTFGERITDGLDDTMTDISTGLEDFSVWFVTSLPYILIWAVIIVIVVIIIKNTIKKQKNKYLAKKEKTAENEENKDK